MFRKLDGIDRAVIVAVAVFLVGGGILIGHVWRDGPPAAASPTAASPSPAMRQVRVEVYGTHAAPLDDCVILPSICAAVGETAAPTPSPAPPELAHGDMILTTPTQFDPFSDTLPTEQTVPVAAGSGEVKITATSHDTDLLGCRITVDGEVRAHFELNGTGTVTCEAPV
jgi:hypothetical protein